jgi:hypothetical protein
VRRDLITIDCFTKTLADSFKIQLPLPPIIGTPLQAPDALLSQATLNREIRATTRKDSQEEYSSEDDTTRTFGKDIQGEVSIRDAAPASTVKDTEEEDYTTLGAQEVDLFEDDGPDIQEEDYTTPGAQEADSSMDDGLDIHTPAMSLTGIVAAKSLKPVSRKKATPRATAPDLLTTGNAPAEDDTRALSTLAHQISSPQTNLEAGDNEANQVKKNSIASKRGAHSGKVHTPSDNNNHSTSTPVLGEISIAYTKKVDTASLAATQRSFFKKLCNKTVVVRVNNKEEHHGFSPEEAADITDFFFVKMMGPSSLHRLNSLITYYNAEHTGEMDELPVARAKAEAQNMENTEIIRSFFTTFVQTQQFKARNNKNELASIRQIIAYRELLLIYKHLTKLADQKNPELLQNLMARGYGTKQGVTWQACVTKFLSEQVGITRVVLTNTCMAAAGVNALADLFGTGIIPILPLQAMQR